MRSGDRGWEVSRNGTPGTWKVGAAVDGGWVKQRGSWGTPFSGFRFAVPEICNFEGRAIYLDADMLVLADIAELWDMKPAAGFGIRAISDMRTDVAVIDCSFFNKDWWPSIAKMKESGAIVFQYLQVLKAHRALEANLPSAWNDCDGQLYKQHPDEVKLLHYTNVLVGQPYRPYPNVDYDQNPDWPYVCPNKSCTAAAKLWWKEYQEALLATTSGSEASDRIARDVIREQGGVWQ